MIARDPLITASAFSGSGSSPSFRIATVSSIQDDRTITITFAGTTTAIGGVRYLGSAAPKPGSVLWIVSQGGDLFALGHIARANSTIAPRANQSTTQSIADATDVVVDFDGVNNDAWGCWASGANSARLTAPITGRFMATATVTFAGNATGIRSAWIEKDGTSTLARVQHTTAGAGSPTWLTVTTPAFDMTKGDYIRLIVRQNSGGSLTLNQSSTFSPAMSLIYLGP